FSVVGLAPLILKSNSASLLVEDYAACLELRSEGCQLIENISDDLGVPGWNDGFSSLENVESVIAAMRLHGSTLGDDVITARVGISDGLGGHATYRAVGGKRVTVVEQVNDFIASTYGIPHTITST
nr:nuclear pore complex protein NUP205 [Tanacetum cinerariifolium]